MDSECSLQDVVRCHLCDTPEPSLHCSVCYKHVCKDCEETHSSDKSKMHKIVPFKLRGCITECQNHSSELCERYCEQCNIPVCEKCVCSHDHGGHKFVNVAKKLENLKLFLRKELTELMKTIYPKYQDIASNILIQKADIKENSKKTKEAINKHGEDLQREIHTVIKTLNSDVDEKESKQLAALNKQEAELTHTISEIAQNIDELNKLLDSNYVNDVFAYKSRIAEFRVLPRETFVSLQGFIPHDIHKGNVRQQFGYLQVTISALEMLRPKRLSNFPEIIKDIHVDTGLRSVSCLSDNYIWTCSFTNTMNLYNLDGQLTKSTRTKSGKRPYGIAVTKSGDLVYTDYDDRTVNIVKDSQIQTVIRLKAWRPRAVCSTSSGDLLVLTDSDDYKQSKVVRYCGSTEKQNIQYNYKGQPLYSSGDYVKYICENKNLDICVADNKAGALVIVNQAGKFGFTYTGPQYTSQAKGPFRPVGITTDSLSCILTADDENECIHILDPDGQLLGYIDNCEIGRPYGLCVDFRDNLFVADNVNGNIRQIRYTQSVDFKKRL